MRSVEAEGDLVVHPVRDDLVVGILEQKAHRAASRLVFHAPRVHTVHHHGTCAGHAESVEVFDERGLSRAVGPHEGDELSGPDVEVDPFENLERAGARAKQDL
jgi:hypothetical protein